MEGGRETYFLCGGTHPGRFEPASPLQGDFLWLGSTPRSPAPAFIGFAAQAKPDRFVSAGVSALHTLSFIFNPGDVMGTQGIGV